MELKHRILEEAARMFSKQGIKSVRMDDIAAACGISKRTLYETINDREGLIRESLSYFMEKYEGIALENLSKAQNAIEEFWIMFNQGAQFRTGTVNVMKDLIKFYPEIFNDFMETHHKKVIKSNKERLKRGQEQGLILKKIDTEFMSRNLTNYLYGMKRDLEELVEYSEPIYQNPSDPHSFPFAIMLFFRGMATEKGRRYIDEKILVGIE